MTEGVPFSAIYQTRRGDTVAVEDPRREAYKQAAYIVNVLGRRYSMTAHEDGAFTVQGDGLASITFEPIT